MQSIVINKAALQRAREIRQKTKKMQAKSCASVYTKSVWVPENMKIVASKQ